MPRFDPDTIAALAEGRLAPERMSEIERAIAADPEAAADLAAHRAALAAIAGAAVPSLTTTERTLLHASIAAALGLEDTPSLVAAAPRRRAPWAAISVAAATVVAIVAIAPVIGLLSTDAATTTERLGAIADATSTTAASFTTAADGDGGTLAPTATDLAGLEAAPTTTVAGESLGTADTIVTAGGADAASRMVDAFEKAAEPGSEASPVDDDTPCVSEARAALGDGELFTLTLEDDSGGSMVILYAVAEDGSVLGEGYDPTDCSLLVTYP